MPRASTAQRAPKPQALANALARLADTAGAGLVVGGVEAMDLGVEDRWSAAAARLVISVAAKTAELTGDGSATTAVLAGTLFADAAALAARGHDPAALKASIDAAAAAAVEALKPLTRPVKTLKGLAPALARISAAPADVALAVAEAVQRVGAEGSVSVGEPNEAGPIVTTESGLMLDRGWLSPWLVTDAGAMTAVLDAPLIALCDGVIGAFDDIAPALRLAVGARRSLLIIADDVDGEALAWLTLNKVVSGLNLCAVKAPGFGSNRRATLGDIAAVTGGKVLALSAMRGIALGDFGEAWRADVGRDASAIVGASGTDAEVTAWIAELSAELQATTSDYDREKLSERLQRVSDGVAVIAFPEATPPSPSALADALAAARSALEEGLVPGGGVALVRMAQALEDGGDDPGRTLLRRALEAPSRWIARNAGVDGDEALQRIKSGAGAFGLEAISGRYQDLAAAGVWDLAKTARLAVQNAAAIAGLLLTDDRVLQAEIARGDQA